MIYTPVSKTEFFPHFLHKDNWTTSLSRINDFFQSIKKYKGITNKSKSEMISAMVLQELAEIIDSKIDATCRTATTDNEPDIIVESIISSIRAAGEAKAAKATRTGKGNDTAVTWRGGEFSKRDGDYFFICWDYTDEQQSNLKWFVCHAYITKEDWTSSIQNGYYATSLKEEVILSQFNPTIIVGSKTTSSKGNMRIVLDNIA